MTGSDNPGEPAFSIYRAKNKGENGEHSKFILTFYGDLKGREGTNMLIRKLECIF
jgi:hypothetical protein